MSAPVLRDVVPADIPGLADISRNTWDGDDYLESVTADWIADGGFVAGEIDGTLFGCYKISTMPGPVAWLEGLRVHPAFRGRGLGRLLAEDSFARALRMRESGEVDQVEFETYYHNSESIAIASSRGFEIVEKFSLLFLPVDPDAGEPGSQPVPLLAGDLVPYGGRVPLGWKAFLNSPRLPGLLGASCSTRESDGLRFFSKPGGSLFTLCSSSLSDPAGAGEAIAREAKASGSDTAEIMVPESMHSVHDALRRAGWSYWEDPPEPNAWVFRMRDDLRP